MKGSCPSDAKNLVENEKNFLQSLIRCYINAGILEPSDRLEQSSSSSLPWSCPDEESCTPAECPAAFAVTSTRLGLRFPARPSPPALPLAAKAASSPWCTFSLVQERLHQDLNFCTAAGCTTDSFCSVFLNCLFYAPTRFCWVGFFFPPPNECCFLPFFICRSNQCWLLLIFHFS